MTSQTFERLVRQHKDSVYRQMVRVCGHKQDAEDALATALLQAFQASDQLVSDGAFRSWLGTIGQRVCTRMRSHAGIQRALTVAEERNLVGSDKDEFELEMLRGCVSQAVSQLPEAYRTVYQRCELEEATTAETAAELGLTLPATKSRLLRARAMVREQLDRSICAV